MRLRAWVMGCIAVLFLLAPVAAVGALEPDEIVLVVNRNVPEGVELARHYAQVRGIPAGRTIELDLPAGEILPFDEYEPRVRDPVRVCLESNQLRERVRCIVTFYGVPLRVSQRALTAGESAELAEVRREFARVEARLNEGVTRLEKLAEELSGQFQPVAPQGSDALARRADHAMKFIGEALRRSTNPPRAMAVQQQVAEVSALLMTPVGDAPTTASTTSPARWSDGTV